ncbi:cytochrome P450 [Diaporthe sp. PMI_573]|nr:cytochrome P450 [Diaporthaceae sp. PMI_573]
MDKAVVIRGWRSTWPAACWSFARAIGPGASPGQGLDSLSMAAVNHFAAAFDRRAASGPTTVKLYEWLRHEIIASTMEATYGPYNPFRNAKNEKAWFELESGILRLLLDLFPNILARRSLKACRALIAEFDRYFNDNRHLDGSLLVQLREKHNAAFGLDNNETAHVEIGQVTGAIVNTAPTAFWLVWQVLADPVVSKDCREEINQLVTTSSDGTHTIDLADVMTACPILVSTWQEVLRFHGISIAARAIKEDTLVDNQYLLKKGGLLMMPNAVIHSDPTLWGTTVGQFNHRRFLKGAKNGESRYPAAAFRGFGGGHVLCPGRHFASTEVLALLALLLVRFDIQPVGGKWIEPEKDVVMDRACPLPKRDVQVELIPKGSQNWRVIFSNRREGINIVAEDLRDNES